MEIEAAWNQQNQWLGRRLLQMAEFVRGKNILSKMTVKNNYDVTRS